MRKYRLSEVEHWIDHLHGDYVAVFETPPDEHGRTQFVVVAVLERDVEGDFEELARYGTLPAAAGEALALDGTVHP